MLTCLQIYPVHTKSRSIKLELFYLAQVLLGLHRGTRSEGSAAKAAAARGGSPAQACVAAGTSSPHYRSDNLGSSGDSGPYGHAHSQQTAPERCRREALAHTRVLLRAALEDFAACQGPSYAFYVGPDHPFLSCRNSGRLECVLV